MISVLYVDDEKLIRDVTRMYLDTQGFPIDTAESGYEALEKLKTGTYDAVVSDYEMPGMNGIALLKEVRIRYPELPFILFTGRGREEVVIEAFDCGADYYLQKGGKPAPQFTELIHKIKLAVEQRNAERIIRVNEERLRRSHAAGKTGCWEFDLNTSLIWASEETYHIYGFHQQAGEMPLEKIEECIIDRQRVHQALVDLIENALEYHLEFAINPADGTSQKIILSIADLERDAEGNPKKVSGIVQDITVRRQVEQDLFRKNSELSVAYEEVRVTTEELRQKYDELAIRKQELLTNQERFDLAMQGANDGLWDWNLETDVVYYSPRWKSMLGYGEDEVEPYISAWKRLIHQEDLNRGIAEVKAYLDGTRDRYEIEFRMMHKDGHIVHILARAFALRRPSDGKAIRLVGTHVDITERKRAEEQIQASNEELAASKEELLHQMDEIKAKSVKLKEIEKQLRLKLENILTPSFDLREEEFGNIIDSQELQLMMDDLHSLTGMAGAILDLQGNILVATGWQDICTKFHRVNDLSCRNCTESDLYLTGNVQPGANLLYKCKNNMWDMVTPIVIGTKHVGNLFIGQFFFEDEVPDISVFALQAEKFGYPREEYLAALERVPRWSREKINTLIDFYTKFTVMISRLSYSNVNLAKTLLEQKRIEEALEVSRSLLDATQRLAKVGGWEWDVDRQIMTWTEETYRIHGLNPDNGETGSIDLIRRSLSCYDREDQSTIEMAFRRCVEEGLPYNLEVPFTSAEGMRIWIQTIATPVREKDRIVKVVGNIIDITERRRTEQALREANRQLNLLTSITRHDINNKITVILGCLEIAAMNFSEPSLKQYFNNIKSATQTIQNQIEFTKLYQDLGSHEPRWQGVDAMIPGTDPDEIPLMVDIADTEVYADPMIERVFLNLLDNSIRHGVRVSEIRVSANQSDDSLTIIWEDNGVGIAADEKERIFERGYGKNTGLGLFLVREILSITGITITETGKEGKGARFEIMVPQGGYRLGGGGI